MKTPWLLSVLVASSLLGCATTPAPEPAPGETQLTVGEVQRKIAIGMSGEEVIQALGSPNVVTTDDQRREVWVWDKVSTTRVDSSQDGYFTIVVVGGSNSSSSQTTTQKTLTIIVKFDENKKVRDFAYHASTF